jgi:hypothetical protein
MKGGETKEEEANRRHISLENLEQLRRVNANQKKKINNLSRKKHNEAKNSGNTHPTVAYIMLGHGFQDTSKTSSLPIGNILVAKTTSGEVIIRKDYISNLHNLLDIKNRETVLDPVGHNVQLYSILDDNSIGRSYTKLPTLEELTHFSESDIELLNPKQVLDLYQELNKNPGYTLRRDQYNAMNKVLGNTSSNTDRHIHSSAIYRAGDTFPGMQYSLFSKRSNLIAPSGIIKINGSSSIPVLDEELVIPDIPMFRYDISKKYALNQSAVSFITNVYKYSNAYEYYFTSKHVEDIINATVSYLNEPAPTIINGFSQTGYIGINKSIEKFEDISKRIIKNYDSELEKYKNRPSSGLHNTMELIFMYPSIVSRLFYVIYKNYISKDTNQLNTFYTLIADIDKDNSMLGKIMMGNILSLKVTDMLDIVDKFMNVTQSDLLEDTKELLEPGVFYNIICRATGGTQELNYKQHISESILQRKSQIRNVYAKKNNKKPGGGTRKKNRRRL